MPRNQKGLTRFGLKSRGVLIDRFNQIRRIKSALRKIGYVLVNERSANDPLDRGLRVIKHLNPPILAKRAYQNTKSRVIL